MLVDNQAKINKLKEEKTKIEKEAFPFIDELDILQKQYEDKEFNQKARMISDDLIDRNVRPDLKANQLEFMRKHLEKNGGPKNYSFLDQAEKANNNHRRAPRTQHSNYDDVDDDLGEAPIQHNLTLPPIAAGLPPAPLPGILPGMIPGGFPGPIPGPVGFPGAPFPMQHPFALPLPGMGAFNNPNVQFLKAQIDKQEEENKRIEDDLLNNGRLLPF